ncbi:MAG: hypothetical protein R2764_22365 [Bacteroidales bacterium]
MYEDKTKSPNRYEKVLIGEFYNNYSLSFQNMKNIYTIIGILVLVFCSGRIKSQDFGYETIEYYNTGQNNDAMEFFGDDILIKNNWFPK